MRKKKFGKVVGKAWVGLWRDGTLGYMLPEFLSSYPGSMSIEQINIREGVYGYYNSDFYRVEITIKPIKNKRGKYIVKRARKRSKIPCVNFVEDVKRGRIWHPASSMLGKGWWQYF